MFSEHNHYGAVYMTAPNISTTHAFTTRCGGRSIGAFKSLNLGISRGDDPTLVRENYRIITRALDIKTDDIVCSRQVHGTDIRVVTRADRDGLYANLPHEADGLITAEPGVALAVFTADCVPILLHDPRRAVIAAVHAGWRGTVADIAGKATAKMIGEFGCGASDISAAIGPCISGCCYETGSDVADAARALGISGAERCITPRGDKYMVDLKELNRLLLIRAGLSPENVAVSGECTYCRSDKYWSHRKTGGIRGSQAAIIALKGSPR